MKINIKGTIHEFREQKKVTTPREFILIVKVPPELDLMGNPLCMEDYYTVLVKDNSKDSSLFEMLQTSLRETPEKMYNLLCFFNGRKYEKDDKTFYANNLFLKKITTVEEVG